MEPMDNACRARLRALLGSTLHAVGLVVSTLIWGMLSLFTWPLPYDLRYRFITQWIRFNLWWLQVTCGIDHHVEGLTGLPSGPAIVMSKHQSTWETIGLETLFRPQTWVMKRELLWLPIFGWALRLLEPIAIDRGGHADAARKVIRQGAERLGQGRWVLIYPEGTRVPPGRKGRYHATGALLAIRTGAPIIPVAHNAGEFWGRHQLVKKPGTIQVRIGPPIDPEGKNRQEIMALVESWIETEMLRIQGEKSAESA